MLRLNNYSLILILIYSLISCKHKSKNEILYQELSQFVNPELNDETRAIIILNENTCSSCNQKFCNLMAKQIGNKKCRFIISANPNILDFSAFIKQNYFGIFIDKNLILSKSVPFSSSTFFGIDHQGIDTIIEINPTNYDQKISYILDRIN